MRYFIALILMLSGGLIFAGCTLLTHKKIIDPKLELKNVRLGQADLLGAQMFFDVKVDNPNDFALEIDSVDYKLDFQDNPVGMGKIDKDLKVEKNASTIISLPVQVELKNLMKAVGSLLGNGTTPYHLKGKARMGLIDLPFEESGTLTFAKGKVERHKLR